MSLKRKSWRRFLGVLRNPFNPDISSGSSRFAPAGCCGIRRTPSGIFADGSSFLALHAVGAAAFFLIQGNAKGITVEPVTPLPNSASLNGSPEMKVWIRGLKVANAKVRLFRRVSPPRIRPDFTVVALPDTQFYTGTWGTAPTRPEIFNRQTEWIANNRASENIAFVAHLGDIALNGDSVESEWTSASEAMSRLENPLTTGLIQGIPYAICPGNHDAPPYFRSFNRHFGVSRFSGRSYYGGSHGSTNSSHFVLFSAAGMDFVVLSLEYLANQKSGVLDWANQVLSTHGKRRAIVLNHSLLKSGAGSPWSEEGKAIYDALKGNSNLFLMLCGHAPVFGRRSDVHEGRVVHTILSDYSIEPNGGNGWLRLMKFSPSANRIEVKTYSPWLNAYRSGFGHEFIISHDMTVSESPFSLQRAVIASGDGILNLGTVAGLVPSTSYDWYVSIEENGVVTEGPRWSFSTTADFSENRYPVSEGAAPFSEPFSIKQIYWNAAGHVVIKWNSIGGRRYRVEISNGSAEMAFVPIIRPDLEEIDVSPIGMPSEQTFVDDGRLTGGLGGTRFYRIREMAPAQPLKIISVSKPRFSYPSVMWNSVGGKRYRLQYSNGNPMNFRDIPRSVVEETDPAAIGSASYQVFEDDGSRTGGTSSTRFYRVKEVP
jgi:hypothetical protein